MLRMIGMVKIIWPRFNRMIVVMLRMTRMIIPMLKMIILMRQDDDGLWLMPHGKGGPGPVPGWGPLRAPGPRVPGRPPLAMNLEP